MAELLVAVAAGTLSVETARFGAALLALTAGVEPSSGIRSTLPARSRFMSPPTKACGLAAKIRSAVAMSSVAFSSAIRVKWPSGWRVWRTVTGMPASTAGCKVDGCSTRAPMDASSCASA